MLEYTKTTSTPYILVDGQKGYMHFCGESFHENVLEFYKDIMVWLKNYLTTDFGTLTFDCELAYFNSSTTKLLLNMFMLMDKASVNGNMVIVNWITTADNEIIIECGEDFAEEITNLTFQKVLR